MNQIITHIHGTVTPMRFRRSHNSQIVTNARMRRSRTLSASLCLRAGVRSAQFTSAAMRNVSGASGKRSGTRRAPLLQNDNVMVVKKKKKKTSGESGPSSSSSSSSDRAPGRPERPRLVTYQPHSAKLGSIYTHRQVVKRPINRRAFHSAEDLLINLSSCRTVKQRVHFLVTSAR